MSQDPFPDYDSDEIDLTNRELVSLFLQYPNMPDEDNKDDDDDDDDDDDSATASDFGEEADSSKLSDITTRTTPLRNDPAAVLGARPLQVFSVFTQKLDESNLPQKAIDYFRSLGYMILHIGRLLFPPTSNIAVTKQDLLEAGNKCGQLLSLLESSCQRVNEQIENVAYILTLAPFTVQPAPEDLWANYKQMAELIIEHTCLPSRHERDLLSCLVRVYDAHVYHPSLTSPRTAEHDQSTQASLDDLYHMLMTLEERYKQWWTDVKEMGDLYTKPTMRRILKSPTMMKEIIEQGDAREAAEHVASDPNASGLHSVSSKVVEVLWADAKRRQTNGTSHKSRTFAESVQCECRCEGLLAETTRDT